MSGRYIVEGARGSEIEESAAFEREERGVVRSDRAHHPHGQRAESASARLQPARHFPHSSRN